MISLAFVNGEEASYLTDPFLSLERTMINMDNEINDTISSYMNKREQYLFESSLMNETDSEKEVFLEAEGNNVFEKIGNGVIALFKKIQDLISTVIQNIKDLRFRHKSYEDKLEFIKKQNPSYSDAIISKIDSGELKITDIKGLADIQKAYNEIIEMSKKKEVDPKTLRGKVEAFKEKFGNLDRNNVIKGATTVLSVASAAVILKKHVLDVHRATNEMNKMSKESYEEIMKAYDELKVKDNGKYVDPDNLSKAEIDRNLFYFYQGKISSLVSRDQKTVSKLTKPLDAFLKKFNVGSSASAHKRKDQLDTDSSAMKLRKEKEREKEREKNKQDAEDKSYGSLMGKQKWERETNIKKNSNK